MIVMRHQPGPIGWEFIALSCDLTGGGKTLAASKATAEHVARHYLSEVQGYRVGHSAACALVRHVVDDAAITA